MAFRILATADIHIGRRPSKLEPDDAQRCSAARMWEAIVERAVREKVDLVALTGDVVDHQNRYFEATGPLERGLVKLADAGIPTYAVAGNHDFDVLSRVVEAIGPQHFHLLGAGGRWEEAVHESPGRGRLRIHGWSFPANCVAASPLADYALPPSRDLPTLGLLHADLDVAESRYAPVARSELLGRDLTIWILGHVHAWQYRAAEAGPAILYPGSPQALDPGETGPHGPWMVEIEGPRAVRARLLPMSRVRYEWLQVDMAGAGTREEFESRVAEAARHRLAEVAESEGPPERLVLRLELTGATTLCGQIDGWTGALVEQFDRTTGGVTARLDKVVNGTRPAIDLDELASKSDPPGVLARAIVRLQSHETDQETAGLLEMARQKLAEVHGAGAYARIDGDPAPDLDAARRWLVRQGTLLLETLRAQERT